MKTIQSKVLECFAYATAIIAIGAALAIMVKNYLILIVVALIAGFIIYKAFSFKKLLNKPEDVFIVNTICTGKKQDLLNLGNSKNYEFEPVTSKDYDKVIQLNILNTGMYNKKQKIMLNHGYTLVFKKEKGKIITDQEHFIGYERYVLPE